MSSGPELPRGTVTFLFTDIEGSTRLLKQLRERYAEVLAQYQEILHKAFAEHDGREIDTQGDSFFVAFRRTKDAVGSAVAAQRALAEHPWPDGVELRVRMGIHTGEPTVGGERYVGLGVHRAARICAAGHGGQVLLSQATRELLRDDPLPGVSLRDLGEHQLKDLDEPEHLYQLVAPGLAETFPLLKTAAPAPFAGREGELAEAAAQEMARGWRRFDRRVVVGPALALAAAAVAATVLELSGGAGRGLPRIAPNSVGVVDPRTDRIVAQVPVGAGPTRISAGRDAAWVVNQGDATLSRIDYQTHLVRTIGAPDTPIAVADGGGSVWLLSARQTSTVNDPFASPALVSEIDIPSVSVLKTIPVGALAGNTLEDAIAANGREVLVSDPGTLTRIDPASVRIAARRRVGSSGTGKEGIAIADGSLWVLDVGGLLRVDPRDGAVLAQIQAGPVPAAVAAGAGAVWVVSDPAFSAGKLAGRATLSRVDPVSNTVTGAIPLDGYPTDVSVGEGSVWVADSSTHSIVKVDPKTDKVTDTIRVGSRPQGIAVGDGMVWVAVD
jgi:YVTN family beta-propeller protein